MSFVLAYTKTGAPAPATACEKSFPTLSAALDFCVRVTALGGEARSILQLIQGVEDGVLEGPALAAAIRRVRLRREAA